MIRVLIVEDDPMVAEINARYIRRLPAFEVVGILPNGQESLRYLEEHPQVDLLILDVYMPKMDGLQMLEELRGRFNKMDVIFVTAAKEKPVIRRGLELGAVDYLIKPFTFERIKLALEKYQLRWELLHGDDSVSQDELDKLFKTEYKTELPKGIHPMTLERVQGMVSASAGLQLDLHSIARQLSVSLVTLRLYLDYLVGQGQLKKETSYGTVGRPTYQYRKK